MARSTSSRRSSLSTQAATPATAQASAGTANAQRHPKAAAITAVELLLAERPGPARDVWLSFGSTEEVMGDGAPAAVARAAVEGSEHPVEPDRRGQARRLVPPGELHQRRRKVSRMKV